MPGLQEAGFSTLLVQSVTISLLQKFKSSKEANRADKAREPVGLEMVPCVVHKTSHNLKKVVNKYGVRMVFSTPCELGSLCSCISWHRTRKGPGCAKKYRKPYVDCKVGKITLSCGKAYVRTMHQ